MQTNETPELGRNRVYPLAATALIAAVFCVLAPWSIPIGPVPLSLTNFIIQLSVYLLSWRRATMSYVVYVLLGMAGLPVFSGFMGGLGKVAGPTGGFIFGLGLMAVIAGVAVEKTNRRILHALAMMAGMGVCYAFGTAWICIQSQMTVEAALGVCVLPFLPGDLFKIVVATGLGPVLRARLAKAGVLDQADQKS